MPELPDRSPTHLLDQAITNVVANAIDAIEDPGEISISTGADAEGYAMSFFTTKPVGQGTGLGLSITYSIIERHRGMLDIMPRTGGGTLAVIRLPLEDAPPSP